MDLCRRRSKTLYDIRATIRLQPYFRPIRIRGRVVPPASKAHRILDGAAAIAVIRSLSSTIALAIRPIEELSQPITQQATGIGGALHAMLRSTWTSVCIGLCVT
jgi:hypothetical protein